MKSRLSSIAIVLALGFVPSFVEAGTILAPHSDSWEYTFIDPTAGPWNTTTGLGGDWLSGTAPFGNCNAACGGADFAYNTRWEADGADGDDLWARREIDFTGYDLSSIVWNLGVDNGFKLYLNGILIASANGEGYTFRWEYSGNFAAAIMPGVNILAVALEDHGGLTAFDMEVVGESVPDIGSTLPLLLTGIGVLGAAYRRLRFRST